MIRRQLLLGGGWLCSLAAAALAAGGEALTSAAPPRDVAPQPRAHAHNDYAHRRPLFDALDHGFGSVEADIYLVDGQLLVAHARNETRSDRTLEALYLDPLQRRVQTNGGSVYPNFVGFLLLIDLKSEAEATYQVLRDVLRRYGGMLTEFREDRVRTNAVTVILSGNRPHVALAAEQVRYAALDGRLSDLDANPPATLVPLISDNWGLRFKWRGGTPLANDQRELLLDCVQRAHRQGRRIRFWSTPDRPEVWEALFEAGVDLLNADDLPGLQRFLTTRAEEISRSR